MNAKHTPAPWTVIGNEVRWLADDETVVTITGHKTLTPRQDANARLIAAAPDLLAALQAIEAETVEGGRINTLARAAIAKATAY